ncbi:hypothetical protein [Methylorubrum thiocyanatum]|uniref:hypothetical protein n=1 Tax=Methylorubrum thiocyanatum TaxID=47958 RepID=UPI0035C7944C
MKLMPPTPTVPSVSAIIIAPKRRTLATLPEPSWSLFGDRPPWQIVSAAVLADVLDLDHALIAVWRQRRLGPQSLPTNWFRGHANGYRVSDIWRWLDARNALQQPDDEALVRDWFMAVAGHSIDALVDEDHPESWWMELKAKTCSPEGLRLTPVGQGESWRWPWR